MNLKLAFILSTLVLTATTEALLPPLYEGIKEIQAILTSKELSEHIPSGDVIVSIARSDDNEGYILTTNKRRLVIHVTYGQTERIGPADFTLHFLPPTLTEQDIK